MIGLSPDSELKVRVSPRQLRLVGLVVVVVLLSMGALGYKVHLLLGKLDQMEQEDIKLRQEAAHLSKVVEEQVALEKQLGCPP